MLKFIVFFGFLALAYAADTVVLNDMVDELLTTARIVINEEQKDVLSIPNIEDHWKEKWKFIHVSGTFECKDGTFKSLSSVKRTGDATMTTNGRTAQLNFKVGLGELSLNFRKCTAKINHIGSMSSKVDASVNGNSIDARITLTIDDSDCKTTIDHIYLDYLGDVSIHTGGGLFHKIENRILTKVVNSLHGKITEQVNSQISAAASKALSKVDLCELIMS